MSLLIMLPEKNHILFNKNPSAKCKKLPFKLLVKSAQHTPRKRQVIAFALVFLLEGR